MLSCYEVTRLLSASQDQALSWPIKIPLQFHLFRCAACHNFSLQLPFLRQSMCGYRERIDDLLEKHTPKS
jgi:hypothetical protein